MNIERLLAIAKESETTIKILKTQLDTKNQELELLTADKAWLQEQYIDTCRKLSIAEKTIQRMEKQQKLLSTAYVKSIVAYLELMDEVLPDWRVYCRSELNQLKQLFGRKEINDQNTTGK